jgi:hypothetical protein
VVICTGQRLLAVGLGRYWAMRLLPFAAATPRCRTGGVNMVGNRTRAFGVVPVVKGPHGRASASSVALALAVAALAACGSSPLNNRSAVPPEFRAACGHPGALVTVRRVPVTVAHADCDLTGVVISYPGYGGATVPRSGGIGIGNSFGLTLTIHAVTLDVTVDATGVPGNA